MDIGAFLDRREPSVLVEIMATRGSTPREAGAFMLVGQDDVAGTIGGGNLEHEAILRARAILSGAMRAESLETVLGPETGQCCGGRVTTGFRMVDAALLAGLKQRLAAEQDQWPDVFLFGAGHVGRALAMALRPLPFRTKVIETRAGELACLADGIAGLVTPMPEAMVGDIGPGGAAVISTHDHALDFLIAEQALQRSDLAYVGMIGSKTKRGVFAGFLKDHGHDASLIERLVLPIGSGKVADKRPEVIAALVAAELVRALLAG
jgi:xanthine dehydrogenase accessory factor